VAISRPLFSFLEKALEAVDAATSITPMRIGKPGENLPFTGKVLAMAAKSGGLYRRSSRGSILVST